ncbi:hypothetical protein LTV02_02435 [Nocardia yamanashiensis]|uniref:hypothetical protein n=1 Tax=Nocardia yamanashiensis TaxID=209247 RepID=UPI00083755CD|nr:hypothetical protein [Nocardia yamanashiensis]UGT42302.1 hypothetical protein LTV02_02435 [Nocardia yamanashiensis]
MKHTVFRATAALALAASAFGLVACSTSEAESGKSAATSSAAAQFESGGGENAEGEAPTTTTVPNLPKPTVQELNDKITKAFDPSVDAKSKAAMIENVDLDPNLAVKLVDAAKANKVKIEITEVGEPSDGKLVAKAKVTMDGSNVDDAKVTFVASGTDWKIDHNYACSIVKTAKLDSAACQD